MTPERPDAARTAKGTPAGIVRSAGRAHDPVIRWLVLVMLLVTIVLAATALSLVVYVKSLGDVPRTSVERQLFADEMAAREKPEDIGNWARLALSYARAERWEDAERALAQGRAIRKAAILDLTEADILRLRGDRGAVVAYDVAIASAKAEYEQQAKELMEEKAVGAPPPSPVLIQALAGRALALKQFGRNEEAAQAASAALEIAPGDAELRVAYGDILRELDRDEEAEAQYRSALAYVPDLQSALDGLKKLGKGR